jgi:hypothetical protein
LVELLPFLCSLEEDEEAAGCLKRDFLGGIALCFAVVDAQICRALSICGCRGTDCALARVG